MIEARPENSVTPLSEYSTEFSPPSVEQGTPLVDTFRDNLFESFIATTVVSDDGSLWGSWFNSIQFNTDVTGEGFKQNRSRFRHAMKSEHSDQHNDPLDSSIGNRVALLSRKYVAKDSFSEEDAARLSILTERVRKLLPSVRAEDFYAMEGALNVVHETKAIKDSIRALLGLNS